MYKLKERKEGGNKEQKERGKDFSITDSNRSGLITNIWVFLQWFETRIWEKSSDFKNH